MFSAVQCVLSQGHGEVKKQKERKVKEIEN